jgi:hypothetical protein
MSLTMRLWQINECSLYWDHREDYIPGIVRPVLCTEVHATSRGVGTLAPVRGQHVDTRTTLGPYLLKVSGWPPAPLALYAYDFCRFSRESTIRGPATVQ